MPLVVDSLAAATLLLDIGIIAYILLAAATYRSDRAAAWQQRLHTVVDPYSRVAALWIAVAATTGSLYLSNVLGWTPCRLCWFQRILMYPLVVVLAVGILLEKEDVADYALPLAMIGAPVAAYHYAVQRIDQFQSAGCSIFEVSCSTEFTFHFGYITIPVMALTAFLAIVLLLWRFSPAPDRSPG